MSREPKVGDPDDPKTVRHENGTLVMPDELCWLDQPGFRLCTRLKGHDGKHAFGTGLIIMGVWE